MDESIRVKRDVSRETCVTSGEIEQLVPMFMRTDILCVTGFLHVFSAVLQLHQARPLSGPMDYSCINTCDDIHVLVGFKSKEV